MVKKTTAFVLENLRALKGFIETNFNDPYKIDTYLSEHKFNYHKKILFKKLYGSSIAGYRLKVRMDNAKRLLRESDTPIKQIAFMAGYSTKQSFMSAFKKEMSITPGKFRKSIIVDELKKCPEDVFTESELNAWAIRNGYSRVVDATTQKSLNRGG